MRKWRVRSHDLAEPGILTQACVVSTTVLSLNCCKLHHPLPPSYSLYSLNHWCLLRTYYILRHYTWMYCNWNSKICKPRNVLSKISQNINLLMFRIEKSRCPTPLSETEVQRGQVSHPKPHGWLMAVPKQRWVNLHCWFSNLVCQKDLLSSVDSRTPPQNTHSESVQIVPGKLHLTKGQMWSSEHTETISCVLLHHLCHWMSTIKLIFTLRWHRKS